MRGRLFGYARVSTTDQHLDRQIEALRNYGVAERDIITDKFSGKDFNRQGYLTLKTIFFAPVIFLLSKSLTALAETTSKSKSNGRSCKKWVWIS